MKKLLSFIAMLSLVFLTGCSLLEDFGGVGYNKDIDKVMMQVGKSREEADIKVYANMQVQSYEVSGTFDIISVSYKKEPLKKILSNVNFSYDSEELYVIGKNGEVIKLTDTVASNLRGKLKSSYKPAYVENNLTEKKSK